MTTTRTASWLEQWQQHGELPTVPEMAAELLRLGHQLDKALSYQKTTADDYARAGGAYRRARAEAMLRARFVLGDGVELDGKVHALEKPTVDERKAYVDRETAQLRVEAELADEMRWATKEAIRSRHVQISALQTLLNAVRHELDFVRTGGGGGA